MIAGCLRAGNLHPRNHPPGGLFPSWWGLAGPDPLLGKPMPRNPKYNTTVSGAHSAPRSFELVLKPFSYFGQLFRRGGEYPLGFDR